MNNMIAINKIVIEQQQQDCIESSYTGLISAINERVILMRKIIISLPLLVTMLLSSLAVLLSTTTTVTAQTNTTTLSSQEFHQQLVEQHQRQQQQQAASSPPTTTTTPPPSSPTPTPTPQQQSATTEDDVIILSHAEAGSDFGSLYIVGEVINNSSEMVNYVQIVGSFYDADGIIIDSDYTYTHLDYLRPGEKSPFRLIITDEAVTSRIDTYALSVNWENVNADPIAITEATVLTINEGERREAEFGGYEVLGEVTNSGTSNTEYVKVVATFYDENGQVIDTEYTYTDPSDLRAGQSAPFEIRTTDENIAEDIDSVKLAVQSRDYFGVDSELTSTTAEAVE